MSNSFGPIKRQMPANPELALGIPDDERDILDAGNDHTYGCKCYVCARWWRLMGPEDPDPDPDQFGPFTRQELYPDDDN